MSECKGKDRGKANESLLLCSLLCCLQGGCRCWILAQWAAIPRLEEKRDRDRGEEAREQYEVQCSEDLYDGRDDKLSLSIRCDVTRCDKCYGTVSPNGRNVHVAAQSHAIEIAISTEQQRTLQYRPAKYEQNRTAQYSTVQYCTVKQSPERNTESSCHSMLYQKNATRRKCNGRQRRDSPSTVRVPPDAADSPAAESALDGLAASRRFGSRMVGSCTSQSSCSSPSDNTHTHTHTHKRDGDIVG